MVAKKATATKTTKKATPRPAPKATAKEQVETKLPVEDLENAVFRAKHRLRVANSYNDGFERAAKVDEALAGLKEAEDALAAARKGKK